MKYILSALLSVAVISPSQASPLFRVLPESKSLISMGDATSKELKSESVKALIWNIKKTQEKGWREEFLRFAKGRDLILIQEAYRGGEIFDSTIESFAGFQWEMGISFLYRRQNNNATGTMIGSYVEPTESLVRHSPDYEPVTETPKSLTFTKYAVEGKPYELLVVSVHAINFNSTPAFKRHMDVAGVEIAKHQGPVLFAGDFNTWNKSRTTWLMKFTEKLGLSPVKFKNGDFRMTFNGFFLDHGFVRGVEVKNAEVLPAARGSDHKPFYIDMTIL